MDGRNPAHAVMINGTAIRSPAASFPLPLFSTKTHNHKSGRVITEAAIPADCSSAPAPGRNTVRTASLKNHRNTPATAKRSTAAHFPIRYKMNAHMTERRTITPYSHAGDNTIRNTESIPAHHAQARHAVKKAVRSSPHPNILF